MNCKGSDLYSAQMSHQVLVTEHNTFWPRSVPVQCTVCLSCGFVAHFVAPAQLEKVRAWKVKDSSK
jgi:hypothetical protein